MEAYFPAHLTNGARKRATCLALRIIAGCLAVCLAGCTPGDPSHLDRVHEARRIVMLTVNSPTTYYDGPDGATGFEYDLARGFAAQLGVPLRVVRADRFSDLIPMLEAGQGDFIAAGMTITRKRKRTLRFTMPYQNVDQQVVYRKGTVAPGRVHDLIGRRIAVVAGSSHVEVLRDLKRRHRALRWDARAESDSEELLAEVQQKRLDLTIADSNYLLLGRLHYPELMAAFTLRKNDRLAWAFRKGWDRSLHRAAQKYLKAAHLSGEIHRLMDRYYGAPQGLKPFDVRAFHDKLKSDLPFLKPFFQSAARRYRLDWRLLAAVSYQESTWETDSVSGTGVRGLMMLTQQTAEHLGVRNREDPLEGLDGGARYLRQLRGQVPAAVAEPDRTWMALAAYNVGHGHVEDARLLAQLHQRNPNRWTDIEAMLPLLARPVWHQRTRYGYARGYEAVEFVTRVRAYLEILQKQDVKKPVRRNARRLLGPPGVPSVAPRPAPLLARPKPKR